MKTIHDQADMFVISPAHDFPGIPVIIHMASPGKRLIADSNVPGPGQLAKLRQIIRGTIDAAQRIRMGA